MQDQYLFSILETRNYTSGSLHCLYYTVARLDHCINSTISSAPCAWIRQHLNVEKDRLTVGDPDGRLGPRRLLTSPFPAAGQPGTLPSSSRPSIERSWRMKGHRRQTQPWSEQRTLVRVEEGSVVRPTLKRPVWANHSRSDCDHPYEA
jgi:hypothetical protein